jgi:hypothetical protein
LSSVVENPVESPEEKLKSDRQRWRSMIDTEQFFRVEIESCQRDKQEAHDALAIATRKHADDVSAANTAEQAAQYSMQGIATAKAKLLESAPDATRKKIKNLETQIRELRFAGGADLVRQYKFQRDRYEQEFAVTREPKDSNEFERYSQKLQRLEGDLSSLQTQLDKALAEAMMVD